MAKAIFKGVKIIFLEKVGWSKSAKIWTKEISIITFEKTFLL